MRDKLIAAQQASQDVAVPAAQRQSPLADPRLAYPAHPQRLLVRFAPGIDAPAKQALLDGASVRRTLRSYHCVSGLALVEVNVAARANAMETLKRDPRVLYVEPDYHGELAAVPDDPLFNLQWGMQNNGQLVNNAFGIVGADIRAPAAWDLFTGDPDLRIAVIDTGVDLTHPDLVANIWTNPGELPGNGIDDDGNGYVDDVHGYDTGNDDGDPSDVFGHGTHVSGIIAAVGNNAEGVVGINWQVQLVPVRFDREDGSVLLSDAIEAIQYAIDNNIRVSNNSWSFNVAFPQSLYDVILASQSIGHLFVAAAGNSFGRDIDVVPTYPASFDLDNIIVVSATDSQDVLAFFSNIGVVSVDLAAPGVSTYSTARDGLYEFRSGTSMSCAQVSGAAALLMGRRPELSWQDVKSRILLTARPLESLAGRSVTGGVLNLAAAIGDCNGNGMADEIDIAGVTSNDCNGNGLPDECEADCNGTMMADDCDIAGGTSADCNGNGVPDECDLSAGLDLDCNSNLVPDACDVSGVVSDDANANGVPDECEACNIDDDCADGNLCTTATCTSGVCFVDLVGGVCDDLDPCTRNDACDAGVCSGDQLPALECAPIMSVRAGAVNGVELPGGATDQITVDRGDRLTIEIFIERWGPTPIRGYNVGFDSTPYTSGITGALVPVTEPTPSHGAFIDVLRDDYMMFGVTNIAVPFNLDVDNISWGAISLFADDCPIDVGDVKYAATLLVDVSANAAGTFQVCLVPGDPVSLLLECVQGALLEPIAFECLTVNVPTNPQACSTGTDCNANAVWDICDIVEGTSLDCNGNDVPDACDITSIASLDCNANLVPDECDIADGTSPDCNVNGVPDACDIASGDSLDCNVNAIPDDCEPGSELDCDNNGNPDLCDLHDGAALDCNGNFIPDVCDVRDGPSHDCNLNALPDECELALAPQNDCDLDGIPDECEADCNSDGVPDQCEVAAAQSPSCAGNGVPDECLGLFSGGLLGSYHSHPSFTGDNVVRVDPTVAFFWRLGEPAPGIGASTFSVRWLGKLSVLADDEYTFFVSTDDGIRLWIDDVLLIDSFEVQDVTEWIATATLVAAEFHDIRIETLEVFGEKSIVFSWSSATIPKQVVPFTNLFYEIDDCNVNLLPDACDLASGLSTDCNVNGVLDVCDLDLGVSEDCNTNALPDECEIAAQQDLCGVVDPVCPGVVYIGNTIGVSADGDADCGNSSTSPDVYYRYMPLVDGELSIEMCNGTDYDAVLSVHTGCPATAENTAACDDDGCGGAGPSIVVMTVIAGEEYIIRVTGWNGSEGNFAFEMTGPACAVGSGDCDQDGTTDICELVAGDSFDCNGNALPDNCEAAADCNTNGVQDICDIAGPTSDDCNTNGVPDECEAQDDCNADGMLDICELFAGTARDCNVNSVLDECDIATGVDDDCDVDGVPDGCEADVDLDGLIDDCDSCPLDVLNDIDGDGICVPEDGCPNDPLKGDPGQCGCGNSDSDFDSDGVADCVDNCFDVPNPVNQDSDGDGAGNDCDPCPFDPFDDFDGDGFCVPDDLCAADPLKTVPGQCGCGTADTDSDADTIADCLDLCAGFDDTIDVDGDGMPDCAVGVPAVSTWGLLVLLLLLLTASKVGGLRGQFHA